jgi:hypothetical protein
VPAGFDAWFDVACAVDPTSRFASAKIAATQLVEALGDAPAASNSGPSLARSDDWVADNGPQSGDGGTRQTHGGKLLSRKRRSVGSSSASLQRIGIDATLEAPPPSPAGGAAPVTERRRRPASVKMTLAAIVMGGLAGGSVVYGLWPSTSKATSAPPAAATSAAAVKPAPAPPPPGADPPIASSPLASTTATEPATPSPERPTSELAAMPRARKATAPVADSHSARPPASAVPPPPAPPPAAASAPAPTRSAKSPFELPPLGI